MTNPLRRADSSPERYTPTHGVRVSDTGFTCCCPKCAKTWGSSLGWRKRFGVMVCRECVAAIDARRALKEAA